MYSNSFKLSKRGLWCQVSLRADHEYHKELTGKFDIEVIDSIIDSNKVIHITNISEYFNRKDQLKVCCECIRLSNQYTHDVENSQITPVIPKVRNNYIKKIVQVSLNPNKKPKSKTYYK